MNPKHSFTKQLLSIVLSIAMILTLLTPTDLTVYADEGEDYDYVVVPQDIVVNQRIQGY